MAPKDGSIQPPLAKVEVAETTQFDDTRRDPYAWMRGKNPDDWQEVLKDPSILDDEVRKHLEEENAYFNAYSSQSAELIEDIGDELAGRIIPNDSSLPTRDGDWEYWVKFRDGGNYPVYMRRNIHTGTEKAYYDGDKERGTSKFFDLSGIVHSPDHKYVAYGLDREGSEYFTVRFRDIETGKELSDTIQMTSGNFVWSEDSSKIYYAECDDNHRPKKIKCHVLGTDPENDPVIYEEQDISFAVGVDKTESGQYIIIETSAKDSNEVYFLDKNSAPDAKPTLIREREKGVEYNISHRGDYFYIHTNDEGATEFKIMRTPVNAFEKENWVDVVPYDENVTISSLETLKDFMVREERAGIEQRIVISDYNGEEYVVDFPDQAFSVSASTGYEFDTDTIRIAYQTPVNPGIVYELNAKTGQKTVLKEKQLPNGHDPAEYIVERKFVTARDGQTEIPVTIIRHKSTKVDGTAPLYQYGYGSYGISIDANFSSGAISLADRGAVYAIAHIRGGGDMGEKWYLDGKMENKVNTFTDFIDVTEALTDEGYGEKGKVCIEGRSAGGMLMGAVINMRPELYAGVIAGVPFVDVLNTICDESLPLTPGEWEEWGNPITDREVYDYMKSYSPYDNIISGKFYPSVLATAGLTDYRVTYWEPAKWIARLRAETIGGPYFMKTEMNAGHAGSAARYEKARERAPEYAFMIKCFEEKGYDMSMKVDYAAKQQALEKSKESISLSKRVGLKVIAPDMDFNGQSVLVTGGADGIGAAEVRALHHLGAHVIALDVQEEKLDAIKAELGDSRITTIPFDLSQTDETAYEELGKKIVESSPSGKIDAYIMNAGVVKLSDGKGVSGTSANEFRTMMQINAGSHADIFRAIAGNLADDARIVLTSSPIVGRADVNTPAYAVTKGALEAFANNIAAEFEGTDKKVVGYVPPPVQNFLRTDLKPSEPLHAHPHGEDIIELPLRLASRSVSDRFNSQVVAMGYDHLRHKDGKNADGSTFDYMPRDPKTNGFIYDLRVRPIASGGGDGGKKLRQWDTNSCRKIFGHGTTPDMQAGQSLGTIYQTPEHVKKFRAVAPK